MPARKPRQEPKRQTPLSPVAIRFAERLRAKRIELDLSQGELAERAAVAINYVSEIERQTKEPGLAVVARLAQALGVQPGVLLDDDQPA